MTNWETILKLIIRAIELVKAKEEQKRDVIQSHNICVSTYESLENDKTFNQLFATLTKKAGKTIEEKLAAISDAKEKMMNIEKNRAYTGSLKTIQSLMTKHEIGFDQVFSVFECKVNLTNSIQGVINNQNGSLFEKQALKEISEKNDVTIFDPKNTSISVGDMCIIHGGIVSTNGKTRELDAILAEIVRIEHQKNVVIVAIKIVKVWEFKSGKIGLHTLVTAAEQFECLSNLHLGKPYLNKGKSFGLEITEPFSPSSSNYHIVTKAVHTKPESLSNNIPARTFGSSNFTHVNMAGAIGQIIDNPKFDCSQIVDIDSFTEGHMQVINWTIKRLETVLEKLNENRVTVIYT